MTNMVSNCVYLESLMFLEVMVMLLEVIVMLLEVTQQVVYRAARAAKKNLGYNSIVYTYIWEELSESLMIINLSVRPENQ